MNAKSAPSVTPHRATATSQRTEHEERTIDVVRFHERAALAVCALRLLTAGQIHQTKSAFLAYEAL